MFTQLAPKVEIGSIIKTKRLGHVAVVIGESKAFWHCEKLENRNKKGGLYNTVIVPKMSHHFTLIHS